MKLGGRLLTDKWPKLKKLSSDVEEAVNERNILEVRLQDL